MRETIVVSGEPDAEQKRCYDCFYMRGACSWWCKNEEAIKFRGTRIPGVRECKFWKPARKVSDLSMGEQLAFHLDVLGLGFVPLTIEASEQTETTPQ